MKVFEWFIPFAAGWCLSFAFNREVSEEIATILAFLVVAGVVAYAGSKLL